MKPRSGSYLVATIILTSACGSGEPLPEEDIATAWAATEQVLGMANVGGATAAYASTDTTNAATKAEFEVDCPQGGSATFTADSKLSDLRQSENVSVKYEVEFDGCESQGVIIDGSIDFDIELSYTESKIEYSQAIDGTLTWSGDVAGSCDVKIDGSATVNIGSSSVQYEYSGEICGQEASKSLAASG